MNAVKAPKKTTYTARIESQRGGPCPETLARWISDTAGSSASARNIAVMTQRIVVVECSTA